MAGANTTTAPRVLPDEPRLTRERYEADGGGGRGLAAAEQLGTAGVIEHLAAAGLRGRGGAGFPTARKWEAVLSHEGPIAPATVVVNAAEGEPGSFKDRAILRANPHAAIEGALIAARTLEADRVVFALKASFVRELALLEDALAAWREHAGAWGIDLLAFGGPREYLYGEETGLLEALEGRPPFPRVAPPYRHGLDEVGRSGSPEPAREVMADGTGAPPTLVSNVETFANVPGILALGPEWFRQVGTDASPGTVVCTVSGDVEHAGVAEVAMGTPLQEVIDMIGGGARAGRRLVAAMSGVANPLVPASRFDVPVSHEGMDSIGSGLGAGGFIVFDDETDLAAVAAGVSRFLAVESCGQCTPCKQDGLALAALLDDVRRSDASERDLVRIADRVGTVADSARCSLASQQQRVITSITEQFPDVVAHVHRERSSAPAYVIAPIVELVDGVAQLDEREAAKQPDWTYNDVDSGASPAERLASASPAAVRIAADAVEEPTPPEPTTTQPPRAPHEMSPSQPHNRVDPSEVADDPEARLYSSAPIDTDEGVVVIEQQNVGPGNEDGGGEWPDPHADAEDPAPGAP